MSAFDMRILMIKSLVTRRHSAKALAFLAGLLLSFAFACGAFGEVIYYDHFDGPEGAGLNGTVPQITTGGAAWVAGSNFDADGTIMFENSGMGDSAYLPFVPREGHVYTLSATIIALVSPYRTIIGTNDWVGVGFTESNEDPGSRFFDDNGTRNPVYWAMTRTSDAGSNDQTFVGPGEADSLDSATLSADDIKIVLDTRGPAWQVSWYFDGELRRSEVVAQSSKPYFQYVAISNSQSNGIIRSFRLEDDTRILSSYEPIPGDGATDVPRDVILSWTSGEFADTHDLFFGTDFNDVNDATPESPPGTVAAEGLDVNNYDISGLEFGTTYYWRVDEVNSPSVPAEYKGQVWSFTVEPVGYKVPAQSISVRASSSYAGNDPNDTINESGLNPVNMDLHSSAQADMWLSASEGNGAWIRYDFDRAYKLHQMMVWNYNFAMLLDAGFRDVTVEYSPDGESWTEVPDVGEFAQGIGTSGYMYNTLVDFNDIEAQSVRLTAQSTWGSQLAGLSEIRFTYIPVWPREPEPADGAVGVPLGVMLTWRAGRNAAQHNVYISTDEQEVIEGSAPVYTVAQSSYSPELELGRTYYWRVDEVNDSETPPVLQGDVWNFATKEYVSIEDFEDYNDMQPYTIWDTWMDGVTDPAYGGSQIGHNNTPFSEIEIVQHGDKSAPISYDNTEQDVNFSEVERTFDNDLDLQVDGADTFRLFYRGSPVTFAEPSEGNFAMSGEGDGIAGTSDQFRFVYKALYGNGSIQARVDSIERITDLAKAGVMIRNTLDGDSAHAMTSLDAGGTASFRRRVTKGATTDSTDSAALGHPCWVRITRKGYRMIAEYSEDGDTWLFLGNDPNVSSEETIVMNNKVYVGLAVCSQASNVLAAATFSSVETQGYMPDDWAITNVGMDHYKDGRNSIDTLYAVLEDSTGKRAKVFAPNTAVGSGDWMEWLIPYSQLTEGTGLDMSKIKKISIGVGDAVNFFKGKGLIYIDNISFGHSVDFILSH